MRHLPRIDREFFIIEKAVRSHRDSLDRAPRELESIRHAVHQVTDLTRVPRLDLLNQTRQIQEVDRMLKLNPMLKRMVQ